jgi:ABC-type enterobactin transport system permease subunit
VTPRNVYAVLWLILAAATVVLYMQEGHVLAVAFTAWCGGVVTANLWRSVSTRSAV